MLLPKGKTDGAKKNVHKHQWPHGDITCKQQPMRFHLQHPFVAAIGSQHSPFPIMINSRKASKLWTA
jgi:hypothetical protein